MLIIYFIVCICVTTADIQDGVKIKQTNKQNLLTVKPSDSLGYRTINIEGNGYRGSKLSIGGSRYLAPSSQVNNTQPRFNTSVINSPRPGYNQTTYPAKPGYVQQKPSTNWTSNNSTWSKNPVQIQNGDRYPGYRHYRSYFRISTNNRNVTGQNPFISFASNSNGTVRPGAYQPGYNTPQRPSSFTPGYKNTTGAINGTTLPIYSNSNTTKPYNVPGYPSGYNTAGNMPGHNAPGYPSGYNTAGNTPGYIAPRNTSGYIPPGNTPGYNGTNQLPGQNFTRTKVGLDCNMLTCNLCPEGTVRWGGQCLDPKDLEDDDE